MSTRGPKTDHVQRATLHFVNPTQHGLRATRASTTTLAAAALTAGVPCADMPRMDKPSTDILQPGTLHTDMLHTGVLQADEGCADMAISSAVPLTRPVPHRVTRSVSSVSSVSGVSTRPATQTTMELGTVHLAESARIEPRARHEPLNRAVNVVIAAVALVLLSPVLLVIALLVRFGSAGPVFYTQVRVGVDRRQRKDGGHVRRVYDLGGAPFTMYKFRTMRIDAEADGRAVWASKDDPRVTPIGRFLRRTRLDELPQLYNVLQGDMNIVGPRPERPALFAQLRENIPDYSVRQRVKPGITGWAQINHSYDTSMDDVRRKVAYDIEYLGRQSLVEDLRIMSLTLPVMFMQHKGW